MLEGELRRTSPHDEVLNRAMTCGGDYGLLDFATIPTVVASSLVDALVTICSHLLEAGPNQTWEKLALQKVVELQKFLTEIRS